MCFYILAGLSIHNYGRRIVKRFAISMLSICVFVLSCTRNMTGPDAGPALDIRSIVQLDHPLRKIFFIDSQHGWAMCDSGGVYRTSNGGGTWDYVAVGAETKLLDFDFVNSSLGWMCGFDATMLHTADGGRTWTRHVVADAVDSIFQHVDFINERDGWMFTSWGDVYGTTNGGGRWELLSQLQVGGLFFVKMWGQQGIAAQHMGSIMRTKDGGRSWSALHTPESIVGQAFFITPDYGWIIQTLAPFT